MNGEQVAPNSTTLKQNSVNRLESQKLKHVKSLSALSDVHVEMLSQCLKKR